MKRFMYVFIGLCVWSDAAAQKKELFDDVPPYGSAKVIDLMTKSRQKDELCVVLSQKDYAGLSLREKFTYNMINAEVYSQNCSIVPNFHNEKIIEAQLPNNFVERSWSERQRQFFKDNRDTVIKLMTSCVLVRGQVAASFEHVIADINAREMIPLLISTYRNQKKKDHDILTVLMLLMRENKDPEFLASDVNKRLYETAGSSYRTTIDFNSANETLILQQAINFYSGLPKKN